MSEEFRILPHDLVAEQSVLGAVFIAPDTIISLADELTPDDFYKPANKIVFKTMLLLLEKVSQSMLRLWCLLLLVREIFQKSGA